MIFRSIILSTLLSSVSAQCSVCGDGKGVNAPDEVFTFPGQPAVPCSLLETAGETGAIPVSQCAFLPGLIGVCECVPLSDMTQETDAPIDPTPAPVVPPTPMPTREPTKSPTASPTPEPTDGSTPAPVPEGAVTPEPTPEPTAEPTPVPTPEPTAEPTPEPTAEPTPEPTAEPTPEPTAEPTPEPTAEPMPVPVDPTPFPILEFTSSPVLIVDDDEEYTGTKDGKKSKKQKGNKDINQRPSPKKDRASRN